MEISNRTPAVRSNYAVFTSSLQPGILVCMMFVLVIAKLLSESAQATLVRQLSAQQEASSKFLAVVAASPRPDNTTDSKEATVPIESVDAAVARSLRVLQSSGNTEESDRVTLQISLAELVPTAADVSTTKRQFLKLVSRQLGIHGMKATLCVSEASKLDEVAGLAESMRTHGDLSMNQLAIGVDESVPPNTVRIELVRRREQVEPLESLQ